MGRQPNASEVDMRRRATLLTRPAKQHRCLDAMTVKWRGRAAKHIGEDPVAWVSSLKDRNDLPLLHAGDLADAMLVDAAQTVTRNVAERRSTYSRANVLAEAHRLLQGVRFAGPDERVAVADRIVGFAIDASLELTTPEIGHTPELFRRPDGTSKLRPRGHEVYTTPELLDAETRLLEAGRRLDGPLCSAGSVASTTDRDLPGRGFGLSLDQAFAVERIATSGRVLDVLVGPAGTGKSTAMAGLRAVWEAEHGPDSVLGLAPSAAAAEVLADELGIDTENTAKWLSELQRIPEWMALRQRLCRQIAAHPSSRDLRSRVAVLDREINARQLDPGQLVIVDEASLAGTFMLDHLVAAAGDAGAKVLLVGDGGELSGVEAGGVLSSLFSRIWGRQLFSSG